LLLAFFVIGSAATKLGYRRKEAARLAQENKGRRGARHALANAGVATAAADTSSSEIGQLLGRRTYLPTNFKPVPRGTEGAVSLEGTLAGILASLVIASLGAAL